MEKRKVVSVKENLLVESRKSHRLATMIEKVSRHQYKKCNRSVPDNLKPEVVLAFQQAVNIIEIKLDSIINRYPIGKRKALFRLRYGIEIDKVKEIPIKNIFCLLKLEKSKIRHFSLVQNLNFNGDDMLNQDYKTNSIK